MVQSDVTYPLRASRSAKSFLPFICFFLTVVLWTCVCLLSRQPGSMALQQFLLLSAGILVCSLVTLRFYGKLNRKIPLLRLISLIGEPLFEDDYYRYMWDGYQTATTNDPYTLAPEFFFDEDVPEIFEPILSLINYPNVETVYGPVTHCSSLAQATH